MRSADSVKVSTFVGIDPLSAFQVFTEEVDAWWKRGPQYRPGNTSSSTMRFEPGVGGRLVEVYDAAGQHVFEVGRVLCWQPGERLVFEWRGSTFRPGERTEVEVRFEAAGRGTRVVLEHRGWAELPPDHPVRHGLAEGAFYDLIGKWWVDLLLTMRTMVRGRSGA